MKEPMEFCVWHEEHAEHGGAPPYDAAAFEATSPQNAAEEYVDARWLDLGQPDEVRVYVGRIPERVQVFDVHAEVQVDFFVMGAPSDEELSAMRAELDARLKAAPAVEKAGGPQ